MKEQEIIRQHLSKDFDEACQVLRDAKTLEDRREALRDINRISQEWFELERGPAL